MSTIKKVWINEKTFYEIDIDLGTQDVAWLALNACYIYGSESFPVGRYTPCMARNIKGDILHPRLNLIRYSKEIGDEIFVKVRPPTTDLVEGKLSEAEEKWISQAFGDEKNMMEITLKFYPHREFQARDFTFSALIKFEIAPHLQDLFPQEKENFQNFEVNLQMISYTLYEKKFSIPYGVVNVEKIIYKDVEGNVKEISDLISKNKCTLEKYPNPLLIKEKEDAIRKKEDMINEKEVILKVSIQKIKESKEAENRKKDALDYFLNNLPFSLEDIYYYTLNEISGAEDEMIDIFTFLQDNDYKVFKKLFQIFKEYNLYWNRNYERGDRNMDEDTEYEDENDNTLKIQKDDKINIDCLMHFYKNYFVNKKEGKDTIVNSFESHCTSKSNPQSTEELEFNFLDFIHSIINILYSKSYHKSAIVNDEINNIALIYEKKLENEYFRQLFRNLNIRDAIRNKIDQLKKVFTNFSSKKNFSYYEMSLDSFKTLVRALMKKSFESHLEDKKDSYKNEETIDKILMNILIFEEMDFITFLQQLLQVSHEFYGKGLSESINNFLNLLDEI